jgi:hypothetical protein
MNDERLALTRATLEKIAIYANHPLKRILSEDTWIALQISDEDLVSLARGLQGIAQALEPKARITRSTIDDKDVCGTVKVVLKQAKQGDVNDATANDLIDEAKKLEAGK